MSEKNIYVRLIGDLSVESNYELTEKKSLTDKEINSIIGTKLGEYIGINKTTAQKIFNDSGSISYSDSVHKKIFSNRKNSKTDKDLLEPDKVYLDIIELKKTLEYINNKQEYERVKQIISLSNEDLYHIQIIKDINKDYHSNIQELVDEINIKKFQLKEKDNKKLQDLFHFKPEDKKKLQDFYKNYLEKEYKDIIENSSKIKKSNEDIENDSFIRINSDIKDYYINPENKRLSLKHGDNEIFEIKELFETQDGENNSILTTDFVKVLKSNKKNLTCILGKDITAKNYLALYLCIGACEKNYSRFFINGLYKDKSDEIISNLEYYLKKDNKKPIFLVLVNIDKLIKENELFNKILNKIKSNEKNLVIFTSDNTNIFKDTSLEKSYNFEINELKNPNNPEFINNLELNAIYCKYKDNSKNITDYIYKYIENTLDAINEREDIEDELKKIAFKAFIGENILKKHTSNKFRRSFDKLKSLVYLDNDNEIKFGLEIIKNYLASEYLYILNDKKYIKFYDSKLIYISEFLASNIVDSNSFIFVIENQELTSHILYNLRQIKNDYKKNILALLKNQEEYVDNLDLLLEISKDYYSKSEYIKSIDILLSGRNKSLKGNPVSISSGLKPSPKEFGGNYGLKIRGILNTNKRNISQELVNHLASCCLDVYLPEISINFLAQNNNDPRIMGNKARALLKLSNINDSENLFKRKLEIHKKDNKTLDILRDKSDILFLNSFKGNQPDLKLLDEILEGYNKYGNKYNINQDSNKAFVLCNLSYYLPFIKDFNSVKNIIDEGLDDNKVKKEQYLIIRYYINLAKYYINNKNFDLAKRKLKQANDIIKDFNLKPEAYLISLYLYYLGENDFKEKAKEYYIDLKSTADQIINKLNQSNLFEDKFSIDSFKLKDYLNYKGEELLKELNSIIVF